MIRLLRARDRHEQAAEFFIWERKKVALAFLALTVLFLVQGLVLGDQVLRVRELGQQNQALLLEQQRARTRNIAAVRAADVKLCQATNGILERDAATLAASPARTDDLLRILGVSDAIRERLRAATEKQLAGELRARAPVDCKALPQPTPSGDQP